MTELSGSKISLKNLIAATLKDPAILSRLIEKQGDTFIFKTPFMKGFVFANPEHIRHIFAHKPEYIRSTHITKIVRNVLGDYGLLGTDDQQLWKKDRGLANTLFTKDKLQEYATIMVKSVTEQLDSWKLFVEQNTPIYIEEHFTRMTLTNLLNTVFGGATFNIKPVSSLSREIFYLTSPIVYPYVKMFGKIPMPLYFRYKKARKSLNDIGDTIVKQSFTKQCAENNLIKCMANGYGYDQYEQLDDVMKQHLNSQALTFLLAGHDTTAAALVHVCVFFSLYPEVAKKAYAEVQTVLGGRDPTYDDVANLPYIRAVIQETLRLWPPGTYFIRTPADDDNVNGHIVKKGELVIFPIYAMHRQAKYWPNPEGFDPDRFLQPLTEDQQSLYMPFGRGPQACIGAQFAMMQATLILAMLAQRYRLSLTPGTSLERAPGMINRLNINIKMQVHPI